MIVRPARSALVRIDPSGMIARWPILRPACARVGTRATSFVYVDEAGAHLAVGGRVEQLPAAAVGHGACVDRVFGVRDGFVVLGEGSAARHRTDGVVSEALPPGVDATTLRGIHGPAFLVGATKEERHFVDVAGARLRPLFVQPADRDAPSLVQSLDDVAGVGVPADVDWAARDGEVGVWSQRRDDARGGRRHTVRLPGRTVVVDEPVALLRDRALVLWSDRVVELRADGADRMRVVLRPDVDAAGALLGEVARERATFVVDDRSGAVLVAERVRGPDCSIDDRVTVVHDDGTVRSLGLPAALRTSPTIVDGVVWFAESDVVYEAFSDDSGTSLP